MNLGTVLAVISIVIVVGPIVSAFVLYRDDPVALVVPDIEELTGKIEDYFPTIEYVGYEVVDPESSFRIMFNVTNNSDEDFTFNTISSSALCSQHEEVFLGDGHGEDFPLTISGKTSGTMSISVTYTEEGQAHVETHRGDENFHVVLKDLLIVVQGVELELGGEIDVGPIEIPM